MVSQRGASVEVHHPLAHDAASRAAGARVVTTAGGEASAGGQPPQEARASPGSRHGGAAREDRGRHGPSGAAHREAPNWRSSASRRFVAGERVVSSRLPNGNLHDHAFCFECGMFFQLGSVRPPVCTRCQSSFVQFLQGAGDRHWISADSRAGSGFTFDDALDTSISASLDEAPLHKTPTQGAFLRALPELKLTEEDIQEREALGAADPRCRCTICRETFAAGETLKKLPCGHEFHDSCCVTWLASHNTCPLCRFKMPEEEDEGQPKQKEGGAAEEIARTPSQQARDERTDTRASPEVRPAGPPPTASAALPGGQP